MELTRNTEPKLMDEKANVSAFYCQCGVHLDFEQEDSLFWSDGIKCRACKQKLSLYTVNVSAHSSASHLVGDEAYTSTWFHATDKENWLELVSSCEEVPMVHVGTEDASRSIAETSYGHDSKKTVYLYEITLKNDTLLGSEIMVDMDEWHTAVSEESLSDMGGDGVRYINRCESPGSVSLLIDPRRLTVKSVRKIQN